MRAVLALGLLLALSPSARAEPALRLRWLGVAGFSLASGESVLLHDPFVSRPGLARTIFRRFVPDAEAVARLLHPQGPAPETASAALVLIGQSHYDHLGDAPAVAVRTGATLAGSQTTLHLAEAYGLERARLRLAEPGDAWAVGPFSVQVVESRHARVLLGRVPLPGAVTETPRAPLHAFSFKLGDARGYLVQHRPSGVRVFLLSSASLHRPALEAISEPVDAVLTSISGRDAGFTRTLLETLRPRLVVPHHFDDFFVGLDDPEAGAPRDPADLARFRREVETAADELGLQVEILVPELFGILELPRSTSRASPESPIFAAWPPASTSR